jgi:ABC-2 type transport system ATP-binding protein
VADGPIRSLLGADGAMVRALDATALSAVLGAAGLDAHTQPGGGLVVPGATTEQVGRIAAAHGVVLTDLRPLEQGLEDLFFSLTTSSDKELVR